jgi:hypothetical protein
MEIAGFPVFFPVNREFAVETGSHMTAHTTIRILKQAAIAAGERTRF